MIARGTVRGHKRYAAATGAALAIAVCATAGVARAATAPPVQWCGPDAAATDRPDAVAGRQVHVVYAIPSDGVDRFGLFASAISTDLTAVSAWWQHQDPTRGPRFDLAAWPCFPSLGALDISFVRLPHDSSYFFATEGRFGRLRDDLVVGGLADPDKKYLVYYDTPSPLPLGTCGQGHEDPTAGGPNGYAEVFIAPNLVSSPSQSGCGALTSPEYRGGYSAMVAAHELLHTLGALDTWDTPGPPHGCPGDAAHACDNPLDIMEPQGVTYWVDDTLLDSGNDDYYAHSGGWWDVQDSTWLHRLDQPSYTLDVTAGAGVAETTTDLPGLDCLGAAHCTSTWDAGSVVTLSAVPSANFVRVEWGGACAGAGESADCTLTLGANAVVTVAYVRQLVVASFAAPRQTGSRLQTKLTLSRAPLPGEAHLACSATKGLKVVTRVLSGSQATCTWSIPPRLRGRRVSGRVVVSTDTGDSFGRAWSLKLRH